MSLIMPTLDIDLENDRLKEFLERMELRAWEKNLGLEKSETALYPQRNLAQMISSYSEAGVHLQPPQNIYEPRSTRGLPKSNEKSFKSRNKSADFYDHLERLERLNEGGGADQPTPPDGIVTAQLWVLMIYVGSKADKNSSEQSEGTNIVGNPIDSSIGENWTVITAFPERWNPDRVPSLQNRIRSALNPMRVGLEDATVTGLIMQVLSTSVNFFEQTCYLGRQSTKQNNVFAAAIAKIVRFHQRFILCC
jgi:hypothetical protein